jgi:hypothetical protein
MGAAPHKHMVVQFPIAMGEAALAAHLDAQAADGWLLVGMVSGKRTSLVSPAQPIYQLVFRRDDVPASLAERADGGAVELPLAETIAGMIAGHRRGET